MTSKRGAAVRYYAISLSVLATVTVLMAAKPAQGPQPNGGAKTAADQFKNIQVLKDIPADQLIPSMQMITNSLGVECDFCHVEGAFDKDDKDEKKFARKMMTMVFAINRDNFDGKKEVSCNTCHRGSPHPKAVPEITAEARQPVNTETMEKEHHAHDADYGPADPVLDAYVKAVGGADALAKLKSATEKASMAMGPGRSVEVDIYEQAPDRRLSVAHMPGGKESITAYNGSDGWLLMPGRPAHFMNADEQFAAKLDAQFLLPSDPRKAFTEFRTVQPDTITGKEMNVLIGKAAGQPPVTLFFDKQSGLLVRMVRYADTPLGRNPTQVDFADYREQGGAKVPFEWTIARPFGRFTMKVHSVQLNTPIDDAKFQKPTVEPPAHP